MLTKFFFFNFEASFRILRLLNLKIFAFLFSAMCSSPVIFLKIIFESIITCRSRGCSDNVRIESINYHGYKNA